MPRFRFFAEDNNNNAKLISVYETEKQEYKYIDQELSSKQLKKNMELVGRTASDIAVQNPDTAVLFIKSEV